MPRRKISLKTGKLYHVSNSEKSNRLIFNDNNDYQRASKSSKYYCYLNPPLKYSRFLNASDRKKNAVLKELIEKDEKLVDIVCYIFLPSRFHFVLKQRVDGGISKYMSDFQNIYTRYFNAKNGTRGSFLNTQFKAGEVKTNEEVANLSRYIHIQPYKENVVDNLSELHEYQWSSLSEYLEEGASAFLNKTPVLEKFDSVNDYKNYVYNNGDYKQRIGVIEHLLF